MEAASGKSNSHGGSEMEEKGVVLESSSIADDQEAGYKEDIILKVSEINNNNNIASKICFCFLSKSIRNSRNLAYICMFVCACVYIYGDWACDFGRINYAIF